MAYQSRSARRLSRQTRYNFLASFIIIAALIFVTLNWVLPNLVNIIGKIKGVGQQEIQTKEKPVSETSTLAPPVIFIPYEATNSSKIDVRGFATARSKVRIFVDDNLQSETEVDSEGSFIAKNIEVSLGTNSIYGKTVDEKGQESLESKQIRLIYDNDKPSLEVTEPQDNQTIKEKKIKVAGKAEKNASVYINDVQVVVNSDGIFSKEQPLNDGDNVISIKAVDSATNTTEISRKIIVQP